MSLKWFDIITSQACFAWLHLLLCFICATKYYVGKQRVTGFSDCSSFLWLLLCVSFSGSECFILLNTSDGIHKCFMQYSNFSQLFWMEMTVVLDGLQEERTRTRRSCCSVWTSCWPNAGSRWLCRERRASWRDWARSVCTCCLTPVWASWRPTGHWCMWASAAAPPSHLCFLSWMHELFVCVWFLCRPSLSVTSCWIMKCRAVVCICQSWMCLSTATLRTRHCGSFTYWRYHSLNHWQSD